MMEPCLFLLYPQRGTGVFSPCTPLLSVMKIKLLLFNVCLLILTLIPRLSTLESHWSSDEVRWLRRSSNFMSAVRRGDFSETRIAYHPGVPTMWIAGLRTFFTPPRVDLENLAAARWFIGLVMSACIVVSIFFVYQLSGGWVALSCFACLAYSPLFLAQTRRVHTDALSTIFILLTVLLFLLYCQHRAQRLYLIFSGMSFGLAILSKSYALILLPWLPVCLFLFRENRIGDFWKQMCEILIFLSVTVLTVVSVWPVFWSPSIVLVSLFVFGVSVLLLRDMKKGHVNPYLLVFFGSVVVLVSLRVIETVGLVFDRVNWAVTTPHEVEHFFLGKVVNDPGWLFYPFVLTIKSTPLMLPLAIVGFILLWRQRTHSEETARQFKIGVVLVIGVLLFTICLSATSKKFSRYLLPAFPMLEILAAIGLVQGFKWVYATLCSRFQTLEVPLYKNALLVTACIAFFFIQTLPVLALHPYYGTYYNLCWKGTDITKIITVGEASGLDLAAKYLNEKPNARELVVQVSPLATEFVYYYFQGRVYRADRGVGISPAYEVVYIRDSQIGRVPQTGTLNGELEALVTLNGIDLVWIYRVK